VGVSDSEPLANPVASFQEEGEKFGSFLRDYGRKDSQAPVALFLVTVFLFRARKAKRPALQVGCIG